MVTETRTDYETVEKEYEVTICDCCKETKDDDQIETVAVNPEYESTRQSRRLAAGEFNFPVYGHDTGPREVTWEMEHKQRIGQPRVSHFDDEKEYLWMKLKALKSEVDEIRSIPKDKLAADCTYDVCHTCLKGFLDVEPSGDDIETPRIVERDLEVDHPKLLKPQSIWAASGLTLIGFVANFWGLNPAITGMSLGMALMIITLFWIERWAAL